MLYKQLIILLVFSLFFSCNNKKKQKGTEIIISSIQYAKGFSIQEYEYFKKLTIHTSFKGDSSSKDYYLIQKGYRIPDSLAEKTIVFVPIKRIVVTSTTHIPMLEILGVENTLVGFPNTNYISSEKTRALIEKGKVQELGQEQSINTELLLDLQPELLIGFGVNNTNSAYNHIEKMGVPIIMNSDWLEKTPLGKAEWLRFFGALYQKDSLAETEFDKIVFNYKSIKNTLASVSEKPTVLSGSLYQDVWYLPAGESFFAQFLEDAQTHYLWKDTQGTGSLSLSFESVLDTGQNAEYWIAPGFYTSRKSMLEASPYYKEFKAYKTGNLYTYALTKGKTGGVLYFELATARPDLVLQDLASILHSSSFPDNKCYFFKKLE